jgi:hypothetical protein
MDATSNAVQFSESFVRVPLKEVLSLNEFFNHSLSTYGIGSLPQILEPSQTINKIQSDLHIANQIPTIHIDENVSAIDYLHANQLEDN